MLTGFARTRWPRLRFGESYAVRISVKIARICEFRVIMGIMTGLLGCCSSSTLGSRANDYVWLHHSPCSLGCWTNNTRAARSLSPNQITVLCCATHTHTTCTHAEYWLQHQTLGIRGAVSIWIYRLSLIFPIVFNHKTVSQQSSLYNDNISTDKDGFHIETGPWFPFTNMD